MTGPPAAGQRTVTAGEPGPVRPERRVSSVVMAGRSPARLLAPLALVAFALALFIVVTSTTQDDTETPAARDQAPAARSEEAPKKDGGEKRSKGRRRYTVEVGDTPSGIAEKTGVSLERLLELNPDLDPQTLAPGTRLKLR